MATDRVSERFDRAFAELHQLFEDDKIDECVELAQNLLEESDIPRYHGIKVLIMLSSCTADWRDAEAYRLEAEQLWSFLHDALAHLRLCLDSCNEVLQKEKPEYDAEMLRRAEEQDQDMEEAQAAVAAMEAPFDDPVELAKAERDDEE
ncbi:hypothetical protein LTR56_010810 [Elasticomyces elasticus]|nr:hypothetical protein LTR56_010810 [Elasticomyces elasticus]KAK3660921.1 hypothetical protein LTR22_007749 [Elasticomyces elasticus]KAK4932327.1 hypothetical protein LTR49_001196 [Elasticomyces elasticus]KAK5768335.1 hypothetical protein LTS12_001474 [Elasticomyces elasticus]